MIKSSFINENIIEEISNNPKLASEIIAQLTKDVIFWQKQYNKAADNISELSNEKQLKVLVEDDICILLKTYIQETYNQD